MNNRESIGHDENSQLNGADLFIVDKIQSGIRGSMDKFIKEKEKELKLKKLDDSQYLKIKAMIEALKFSSGKGGYLPKDLQETSFFWMPVCVGYTKPGFTKKQYLQILKAAKLAYKDSPNHLEMSLFPNRHHEGLDQDASIKQSIALWNQEEPLEVQLNIEGGVSIQPDSEFSDLASLMLGAWSHPPQNYEQVKKQFVDLVTPEPPEKKTDALKANFIAKLDKDMQKNAKRFAHVSFENRQDHIIREAADLIARVPIREPITVNESGEVIGISRPKILIVYHAHSELSELMKYAIEKAIVFDRESSCIKDISFFGAQKVENKKSKSSPDLMSKSHASAYSLFQQGGESSHVRERAKSDTPNIQDANGNAISTSFLSVSQDECSASSSRSTSSSGSTSPELLGRELPRYHKKAPEKIDEVGYYQNQPSTPKRPSQVVPDHDMDPMGKFLGAALSAFVNGLTPKDLDIPEKKQFALQIAGDVSDKVVKEIKLSNYMLTGTPNSFHRPVVNVHVISNSSVVNPEKEEKGKRLN